MNADNDYQIGKDHLVCQDYSLAAACDTKAYAIVSDGCSASRDVDIGARVLAMSAREALLDRMDNYKDFGDDCIRRANAIFSLFPHIHPQALDATLLVAKVDGDDLKAFLYGDGVFIHKSEAGLYALRVELTSGAPDYLSYHLDYERRKLYDDYTEKEKETKQVYIMDEIGIGEFDYPPFAPVVASRKVKRGDVIAVISDGIGSFRRPNDTTIPWTQLIEEFIGFKVTAGVFVKRRMAAFQRKCIKEGITHSDDISIASIIV